MRVVFGNWKYLFKNIWYILPCGIVPAIFLALSFDYTATKGYVRAWFAGNPHADFAVLFRAFSPIRVDSVLGGLYSVLAFVCVAFFAALIVALVEKHMRIGKRTLSGAGSQLKTVLLPVFCIMLLYASLGELWALILSALVFAISSIASRAVVYLLSIVAFLAVVFLFLYLTEVFFLWIPCVQATGFRPYDAFLYSYRLGMKVRWKIILSFAISFFALAVVVCGMSFLPEYAFRIFAFLICLFLYMGFFIRMETVYFYADKIDREDLLRSYREL